MEFDKDGRIILPTEVREEKEREGNSLILTKIQISLKSPAVAHLKIEVGTNLNVDRKSLLDEIANFCEYYAKNNFRDVDSNVLLNSNNVLVVAKSSMLMYSFLNQLAGDIKMRYRDNQKYDVVIKGSFDKF